jgi:Mg2+/citrate symporter
VVGRIRFALERFDSPRHRSHVAQLWTLGSTPLTFMNGLIPQKLVPKIVALIIVSSFIALCIHGYGTAQLAKIDSMTLENYIAHKRHVYHSSYAVLFFGMLFMGGFYIGVIEIISYVIRKCFPNKPDA